MSSQLSPRKDDRDPEEGFEERILFIALNIVLLS
jgi:hypothetical protein